MESARLEGAKYIEAKQGGFQQAPAQQQQYQQAPKNQGGFNQSASATTVSTMAAWKPRATTST